jgi:hypothetical protein
MDCYCAPKQFTSEAHDQCTLETILAGLGQQLMKTAKEGTNAYAPGMHAIHTIATLTTRTPSTAAASAWPNYSKPEILR